MFKKLSFLFLLCALFAVTAAAQADMSTGSKTADAKSTKRGPIFRPTKDQIKQVQTILKDKKLYNGEATGVYNDDTRTGIKSFQKSSGLRETGTLNRATLEKFGVELTDAQKAIPVTDSSTSPKADTAKPSGPSATGATRGPIFRANADQIKAAQKMLKDAKMYAGEETGKLDADTRSGLVKYQTANGIKATGTLNQVTLDKMGIPLTDAQKASAKK